MAPFCQENQLLSVSKPSECPKGAHHLTMRHCNFTHCRPFSTGSCRRRNTHSHTPKSHTNLNSIKTHISAWRKRCAVNLSFRRGKFLRRKHKNISYTSPVIYKEKEDELYFTEEKLYIEALATKMSVEKVAALSKLYFPINF